MAWRLSSLLEQNDGRSEFHGDDGRTFEKSAAACIIEIVEPRVEEIFSRISETLQDSAIADRVVPAAAVLTGGRIAAQGIEGRRRKDMQLVSRQRSASRRDREERFRRPPEYATAVGLWASLPRRRAKMGASATKSPAHGFFRARKSHTHAGMG